MEPLPKRQVAVFGACAALAVAMLIALAYRLLPSRSFAADDFQWLLGAHSLSFDRMLSNAFNPDQNHFYRPLIWVAFWSQDRLFSLDPRGFHQTSLLVHCANALLLGLLVWRCANSDQRNWLPLVVAGCAAVFVGLHPAPFEAITWVSAQSDLFAAFWLLAMLHLWLAAARTTSTQWRMLARFAASLLLALALLSKEAAVIGLPLLVLLDLWLTRRWRGVLGGPAILRYVAPILVTCVYLVIQLRVERENYVVGEGVYALGPHILTNPLRALALLIAPLPFTEHADAAWLVPVGALVALLIVLATIALARVRPLAACVAAPLALAATLLPTAPFVAPPNSRYLYLPLFAFTCVLVAFGALTWQKRFASTRHWLLAGAAAAVLLLGAFFSETIAREERFARGSGADGSLWRAASSLCVAAPLDRIIVVNAPLAENHARAVLRLACGKKSTPIFVDSLEIAQANLETNSAIIDFPNGSARIVQHT